MMITIKCDTDLFGKEHTCAICLKCGKTIF